MDFRGVYDMVLYCYVTKLLEPGVLWAPTDVFICGGGGSSGGYLESNWYDIFSIVL